ncbi:MAG: transcription factor S [Methanobacteriaceae archaeon]|nr:transcription factor S [Methanobacteriaceae archaeon]
MDFCPKCGGMMLPNGDKLECKTCGETKTLKKGSEYEKVSEEINTKDTVVMTDGNVTTRPTTNVICPECGHGKAEWWLQQTRSADEAPTRFFKCLKCKHTWREYD